MREAVAALSPEEAQALLDSPLDFEAWVSALQVHPNDLVTALMVRSREWKPPPPPPEVDLRRPDAGELRRFIDQCAARLEIARATVRVHLRRLRETRRECERRERPRS